MSRECVLLIHGLGESELNMLPLSMRLSHAGYRTVSITYPSTLYPVEQLAEEYIAPLLYELEKEERLHVVTHSVGGILLRTCLQIRPQKNLERVVMMTPAHHGSKLLELYRHHPLFNLLCGPVVQQSGLGDYCFSCGLDDVVDYELGIIAGCVPVDPLSLLVMRWPHDGRTTVASTTLKGMKDHIVIPASHELITFHPLAVFQTQYFLQHGRFFTLKEDIMNATKNKDENAKNSDFKVPMDLPGAKPGKYDVTIDSSRGSAGPNPKGQTVADKQDLQDA